MVLSLREEDYTGIAEQVGVPSCVHYLSVDVSNLENNAPVLYTSHLRHLNVSAAFTTFTELDSDLANLAHWAPKDWEAYTDRPLAEETNSIDAFKLFARVHEYDLAASFFGFAKCNAKTNSPVDPVAPGRDVGALLRLLRTWDQEDPEDAVEANVLFEELNSSRSGRKL
ncbi:MAG: hypothetical protein JST35_03305 [Armatimonadetes bacterium]|nr:hypothetical protein [Armatimonadota bacterium]